MRSRGGLLVALTVIVVALVAAPAQASSRDDYVAKVDPICQQAIPAAKDTVASINRSIRRYVRDVVSGVSRREAAKRYFNRISRAVFHFTGTIRDLEAKIAAVPVPPADSGYVTLWLRDVTSAMDLADQAARALRNRKFRAFHAQWEQALAVDQEADVWVGGFGFQYCVG
jgi:hypothetical protein